MKLRSRLLAIISAILGLALFIYVIRQTGLAEIWSRVQSLGAGFLLILAISSTRYLVRSLSWLRCMLPEDRKIGFWTFWRARLAGEAIGDLTFGPMVAEPLRLIVLSDRLSLSSGISSLAVENIAYTLSACLMVLAGAISLLASYALQESVRTAVLSALVAVIAIILAAAVVINRRWNIGSGIATLLARLLIPAEEKRQVIDEKIDHLRRLEEYIFDFYARRPGDFFLVALCQAAFHLAGVLEIYLTLRLIGVDLTLAMAFMLEGFNRAINIAFIFVPALVGVDEAGTGLITSTLGFGAAAGVALAIIRKIRMFFWIGIGLVFLAASRRKK